MAAAAAIAGLLALTAVTMSAARFQRRESRGFDSAAQVATSKDFDGGFQFCRLAFRNDRNGDGAGWSVDWPRADENLSFRFSELTRAIVSRAGDGEFNHVAIMLTDEERLAHCPFIMITEPGGTYFDEAEAMALRRYLQRGGFMWADDFWGDYAFEHWINELRKALPSSDYPLTDLTLDHPIFHVLYDVKEIAQIPSISFWYGTGGGTSERGRDSATATVRAVSDRDGRVLVVMTHNSDFGDAFEREGDSREYFEHFAGAGYAFGVNTLLYSMTH